MGDIRSTQKDVVTNIVVVDDVTKKAGLNTKNSFRFDD